MRELALIITPIPSRLDHAVRLAGLMLAIGIIAILWLLAWFHDPNIANNRPLVHSGNVIRCEGSQPSCTLGAF